MDRPTLHEALASVAQQTYSNIEVVVVPACGDTHSALDGRCGDFPLMLASAAGPLSRSEAANLGMQCASGTYLIFLDDDDLWLPEHVAKLVGALVNAPQRVAYTGVKLVNTSGDTILTLDEPWEPSRLRGANYIPIHAVLFARSLLDLGCRFNDGLECMEDWEFWLQLSRHTDFLHVPGVSAVYRYFLGNSGLSNDANAEKHLVNRAAIFGMWQPRFSSREWVQTLFWFETSRNQFAALANDRFTHIQTVTQALEKMEMQLANAHSDNHALAAQIKALSAELTDAGARLTQLRQQCAEMDVQWASDKSQIATLQGIANAHAAQAGELGRVVQDLVHSTSWRITGPLRFVSRLLSGQHNQALASVRRRARPLARWAYYRVPPAWRGPLLGMAFRMGAPLFRGMGHYEMWRQQNKLTQPGTTYSASGTISALVDIANIAPMEHIPAGTIAIHAHIFYDDLVAEFAAQLAHMPFGYDLFVSVPTEGVRGICERAFKKLPLLEQLTVSVVPNRGATLHPCFALLAPPCARTTLWPTCMEKNRCTTTVQPSVGVSTC
ncbi:MAG: glycosyltransferase [Burkholderiales bacterium]|nr:glycosyltransferase [Burkholderiales bacterium]